MQGGIKVLDIKKFLSGAGENLELYKRVISYIEGEDVDLLNQDSMPKKYNETKRKILSYMAEKNILDIVNFDRIIVEKARLQKFLFSNSEKRGIETSLSTSDIKKFLNAHEDFEAVAKRVLSYILQVSIDMIGVDKKMIIISEHYSDTKVFLEEYLKEKNIYDLVVNDVFHYNYNQDKK